MNVYHIIDHEGFGTIHKLLMPLCNKYFNHSTINLYNDNNLNYKIIKKINSDDNAMVIIHSTGRINSDIMLNFNSIFEKKHVFIFLHTSYNYQRYKKREKNINYYKDIENNYNVFFIVPSLEVKKQYCDMGLKNVGVVQLGIDNIESNNNYKIYRKDLSKYYDKIVTTCSSSKEDYKYIKGIDLYMSFITKNSLFNYSLIAGIDDISDVNGSKFLVKKFNEEDFLNVLYHSKMYVQFSRFESYNITAIQAKRFKVPIFLLKAEGNYNCMNGKVYEDISILEQAILNNFYNDGYRENIIALYLDSVKRENLETFKNTIKKIGGMQCDAERSV